MCCALLSLLILTSQYLCLRGEYIDQAYFLNDMCNQMRDPLHSLTLRLIERSDLEAGEYHVPTSDVDCYITFVSPTFSDSLTRKISIKSRDAFFNIENPFTCMESEDNDISNCAETNAYIQVFYGDGRSTPMQFVGTYCGSEAIGYLEAPAEYTSVTIRLVIKSESLTTTPTSNVTMTTENGLFNITATNVTESNITTSTLNITSTTPDIINSTTSLDTTRNDTNISTCGTNFTIDITMFIVGDCNLDGPENNDEQFYCEDEDKCISDHLRCDAYLANNCGDYMDNFIGEPAYCGTEPDPPKDKLKWLWLIILLVVLSALALLYWCCWRPGWLPWRLGCLRNCCYDTCCLKCSTKCNSCCCKSCASSAAAKEQSGANTSDTENLGGYGQRATEDRADKHARKKKRNPQNKLCCCLPTKVNDEFEVQTSEQPQGKGDWEQYFSSGGLHMRRYRY